MFKNPKRDKAEGTLDRIGGRVLELLSSVTGSKSQKAKGKAARGRGRARRGKGRAKSAVR